MSNKELAQNLKEYILKLFYDSRRDLNIKELIEEYIFDNTGELLSKKDINKIYLKLNKEFLLICDKIRKAEIRREIRLDFKDKAYYDVMRLIDKYFPDEVCIIQFHPETINGPINQQKPYETRYIVTNAATGEKRVFTQIPKLRHCLYAYDIDIKKHPNKMIKDVSKLECIAYDSSDDFDVTLDELLDKYKYLRYYKVKY